MAKAIFHKPVGYTQPKGGGGWYAEASKDPQSFPEEFIAYAVEAGAATRVGENAKTGDQASAAKPAAN
ncbi:hypothetical protein DRW48_10505 [Paracoccus suum]|uniref:Uncharacterized protein n=1 Tax=Paracoccus suum TaxID=2259340 RepID=A0A344PL10_9RHOB|nr:hypothetical protein [Paracoccus suum]AXC50065.1 hypothetical protein DRW48_10505 [Paracoccus suum]